MKKLVVQIVWQPELPGIYIVCYNHDSFFKKILIYIKKKNSFLEGKIQKRVLGVPWMILVAAKIKKLWSQ